MGIKVCNPQDGRQDRLRTILGSGTAGYLLFLFFLPSLPPSTLERKLGLLAFGVALHVMHDVRVRRLWAGSSNMTVTAIIGFRIVCQYSDEQWKPVICIQPC